ncbi:MAG: hypothetical protein Q9204_004792 [Flavoplaca sp. TL-2023a]
MLAKPLPPPIPAPPPSTIPTAPIIPTLPTLNFTLTPTQYHTNEEVRLIHYSLPHTNIDLDILLFLEDPLSRPALGRTIHQAISRAQARLDILGDDWLSGSDDPFLVTNTVSGKCFLRIESRKESGRSRMTYKTLVGVFLGLWNVLYMEHEAWAVSLRVMVAGVVAGHGAIADHELLGPGIV